MAMASVLFLISARHWWRKAAAPRARHWARPRGAGCPGATAPAPVRPRPARRHRAHRGAHDVGDIGGMEHRQADDQRGEFDAGLPAALQAQSAPDRQFDDGRGQEGPGEQLGGQRQPGRDANEQNVSAMRGSVRREPPASNRPARDQHGDNQARRLRQPAVQRRQRQSAIGQQHRRQRLPGLARVGQAQQQAVPDEELQQHRGVAQRRDDDGRQPRRHRLGRQARQASATPSSVARGRAASATVSVLTRPAASDIQ